MSIIAVRTAMASAFTTAFPGVKVVTHGGRMDVEEIKRWATGSPAIIIACLGVPRLTADDSMVSAEAAWAACVVGINGPSETLRDAVTLALVAPMLRLIGAWGQRWNNTANKAPVGIRAENAYSPTLDRMGVSLWAITWTQAVDLPDIDDVQALALSDFLKQYTTWAPAGNLSTTPDTATLETIPQASGATGP